MDVETNDKINKLVNDLSVSEVAIRDHSKSFGNLVASMQDSVENALVAQEIYFHFDKKGTVSQKKLLQLKTDFEGKANDFVSTNESCIEFLKKSRHVIDEAILKLEELSKLTLPAFAPENHSPTPAQAPPVAASETDTGNLATTTGAAEKAKSTTLTHVASEARPAKAPSVVAGGTAAGNLATAKRRELSNADLELDLISFEKHYGKVDKVLNMPLLDFVSRFGELGRKKVEVEKVLASQFGVLSRAESSRVMAQDPKTSEYFHAEGLYSTGFLRKRESRNLIVLHSSSTLNEIGQLFKTQRTIVGQDIFLEGPHGFLSNFDLHFHAKESKDFLEVSGLWKMLKALPRTHVAANNTIQFFKSRGMADDAGNLRDFFGYWNAPRPTFKTD